MNRHWKTIREHFDLISKKAPSNICGGPKCCVDRVGNFSDPFCKECSDDYDSAMEHVNNPTPDEIAEAEWLYNSIMGKYNVMGV